MFLLPPLEWALSPIRQLLVTTKCQYHLLHFYVWHSMLVIVLFNTHCSWVGLLSASIHEKLTYYFISSSNPVS